MKEWNYIKCPKHFFALSTAHTLVLERERWLDKNIPPLCDTSQWQKQWRFILPCPFFFNNIIILKTYLKQITSITLSCITVTE